MRTARSAFIWLVILSVTCSGLGMAQGVHEGGQADARMKPLLSIYNVAACGIKDTSAVIQWNTNYDSDSAVEYGLDASYGSSKNDSTPVKLHSITLENLTGSTKYHFRVLSRQSPGDEPTFSDDYTFITTAPEDTLPPLISNMLVEGINETQAFVVWNTDEPATSCVRYGNGTGYGLNCSIPGYFLKHNVTVGNLTPDTKYYCQVVSEDPTGNRATSEQVTFRTKRAGADQDQEPPRVSNVQVQGLAETIAVVSWETDEPATSAIDYGTDTGYGKSMEDRVIVIMHSIVLANLSPSTCYHFMVKSTDAWGNGPNVTGDFNFTTRPHTSPPQITIISPGNGTACGNAVVRVAGTAADDFAVVRVELSLNHGPWKAADGTSNWSCDLTIMNGTNNIVVRATDEYGNINSSNLTLILQAPAIEITTQHNGQTVATEKLKIVSGTVNSSAPVKAVNVTVNGVPVPVEISGNNWSVRDVPLMLGKNTIMVSAVDASGNNISSKISVTYSKPRAQPGFEAPLFVAAVLASLAILGRRRGQKEC